MEAIATGAMNRWATFCADRRRLSDGKLGSPILVVDDLLAFDMRIMPGRNAFTSRRLHVSSHVVDQRSLPLRG